MTAAVVLAAGGSSRLGRPKQLVEIDGETLLERAVRTARDAGCQPVVVVLGAQHETILTRTALGDAIPVINQQWAEGLASSIQLGLRTLNSLATPADGAVLMTCDQPAVTPTHLSALIASGQVTASAYAGRHGVPAYFPATAFAQLMKLQGDAGARELLGDSTAIELPGGELDVDTAADVEQAKRLFA